MKKIPLIETNPYLKNPAQREKMLVTAVVSSTSIEGVHVVIPKNDNEFSPVKTTKIPKKLS